MNIGLFTWFNDDRNCGQTLQAYALERVLEKEYSAKVIIINYKYLYLKPLYRNWIGFNLRNLHINIQQKTLIRQLIFDFFIYKRMHCSKPLFSKREVEQYLQNKNISNLMLGSDQLWNPETGDIPDVMLFNFTQNRKLNKCSYSPSMCSYQDRQRFSQEIKKIVKIVEDFDFIGVRENSAKRILKEYGLKRDVSVMLDPVFLLNKDEWIQELRINVKQGKYLLIYCLGMITNELMEYVNIVLKEKKCSEVLYICTDEKHEIPNNWKKVKNVGPKKFIELVCNSVYILGDSFHMVCFAIIFRKNFICFRGKRKTFIPNADRIIDLLNRVKLSERFLDESCTNIIIDINYDEELEYILINTINDSKQKLNEMVKFMIENRYE